MQYTFDVIHINLKLYFWLKLIRIPLRDVDSITGLLNQTNVKIKAKETSVSLELPKLIVGLSCYFFFIPILINTCNYAINNYMVIHEIIKHLDYIIYIIHYQASSIMTWNEAFTLNSVNSH